MTSFSSHRKKLLRTGFTIIELLIVITVVGILAAITIVAYPGVQKQARESKMDADIKQLTEAVTLARAGTKQTLFSMIGTSVSVGGCTGCDCRYGGYMEVADDVPKTSNCWNDYQTVLKILTEKSGINVMGIVDPWGRPYDIDQNEGESPGNYCRVDYIASYQRPYTTAAKFDRKVDIPFYTQLCS